MSLDDRYELFGGPTETLAAEGIWLYRESNGRWPLWDEAIEYIAEGEEVAGDRTEAERRLRQAILAGEVVPRVVGRNGVYDFFILLPDDLAARMQRRYMDNTMLRREDSL